MRSSGASMSDASASQAEVAAARLLLARMGISPADLLEAAVARPSSPTFAEYVPVVAAAVSEGTQRAYGSYWNRVVEHWGQRRLDEPTPSEIEKLAEYVKTHVVARRNARGGRSAAEHLIAALRCLYKRAVADGFIAESDNPALKAARRRQQVVETVRLAAEPAVQRTGMRRALQPPPASMAWPPRRARPKLHSMSSLQLVR